ncbi:hypothetical protein [Mucilaginibacter sp. dw_454]|uniref:hypothetical protein n=1 Tax=Mucilaginibacter sp. dw_454 TaxID=2720079 RepID=UPI001BD6C57C|nr:hypothetical protein [Mucilaginibacter sp. dw_454]
MLKVIFTAAIVLSVGVLSLLKTSTPAVEKVATPSLAKAMVDSRANVLASAD